MSFFFSVNQESPFLLVLPRVLQPSAPALAGLIVIFSDFGLNPCHLAIDMQMCFGVKQLLRAPGVFGRDPLVTSEKVCGPTFFGSVLLTISSSSPTLTDSGATNFSAPLDSSMVIVSVTPVGVTAAVASPGAKAASTTAVTETAKRRCFFKRFLSKVAGRRKVNGPPGGLQALHRADCGCV